MKAVSNAQYFARKMQDFDLRDQYMTNICRTCGEPDIDPGACYCIDCDPEFPTGNVFYASDIPQRPYYVTCIDPFMSGWGQSAGKENMLILPCVSYEQAQIVATNAENRGDQEKIRISDRKPTLNKHKYHYSLHGPHSYKRWYRDGGFTAD